MHPEEFVLTGMTVTHWKEQFESLAKYSSESVSKVLKKLGIETVRKKIAGKVERIKKLPKRKNY